MKKLVILAAMFALVGCASSGHRFDMADVDAFQPGVTTYDEVVQKLGKPGMQAFGKDGQKIATWTYAGMSGLRGAGMEFDKDGKLVRVTSKIEH